MKYPKLRVAITVSTYQVRATVTLLLLIARNYKLSFQPQDIFNNFRTRCVADWKVEL